MYGFYNIGSLYGNNINSPIVGYFCIPQPWAS